jgi:hypothetical protein
MLRKSYKDTPAFGVRQRSENRRKFWLTINHIVKYDYRARASQEDTLRQLTSMKKFLVLYQSEAAAAGGLSVSEMIAKTPPEQMQKGMAMWRAWFEKCGSACVDLGSPLDNSTTVTKESSKAGRSAITGYSVVEAGSMEEAIALMVNHPHFFMPGASAQILECVPMPGM